MILFAQTPAPTVHLEIPGEPFALHRARAARRGKFARVYDPEENVSWKAAAGQWMLSARTAAGIAAPFTGPVSLAITALFSCPKSDERKRDPRPERWSLSQKDADNIAKAVGDAGNGVLWNDDRQVVDIHVRKRIAAQGEPPRVVVTATELP